MKVRDVMTNEVAKATLDSTVEDVAAMMKDEDTGAIPVVDDGELAGIITDRDIVIRCIAEGKAPADTTVEEILTEELHTIEPDADVDEAARMMSERQIRRLPVVQGGELVGVISLGDIAVNEGDAETAGSALQDISQGTKQESKGAQPKRRAGGNKLQGRGKSISDKGEGRAKVTPIRGQKQPKTARRKTG